MDEEDRRQQVARLVKRGRVQRGLSLSAAAREAGIDRATWTGVEKATRVPRDAQRAAIERVAGLAPETITDILEGARPAPPMGTVSRETRASILSATPEQLVEMRQVVEDVMGAEAADEFLRRAIALRTPPPTGGGERAPRRDGRAAG